MEKLLEIKTSIYVRLKSATFYPVDGAFDQSKWVVALEVGNENGYRESCQSNYTVTGWSATAPIESVFESACSQLKIKEVE